MQNAQEVYPGASGPPLSREERFIRLLTAKIRGDKTEIRLLETTTPQLIYEMPDTLMPRQMLNIQALIYVADRLASCCGLRASEIAQLRIADVHTQLPRPHLKIRAETAKGGRPRTVPLWWDAGTLADIAAWKVERIERGAMNEAPFIGSLRPGREGTPLSRHTLRKRFRTACKVVGAERLASLTIHHGRHAFISHALAGGLTLAEVRDAAGHVNVSITSRYLHIAVDDQSVGQLFAYHPVAPK